MVFLKKKKQTYFYFHGLFFSTNEEGKEGRLKKQNNVPKGENQGPLA